MSDLFSDAAPPPPTPDRTMVLEYASAVPVPPEHAFAGFTENIHLWWPAEELSVWGPESFFDLEDKALVETSISEAEAVWAEVRPTSGHLRLDLIWHHQPGGGEPTEVTIGFHADPTAGTVVSLAHDGWTTEPGSREQRKIYQIFWPLALEKFSRFMGGTP